MEGRPSLAWRYPPDAESRTALRQQLVQARTQLPAAERTAAQAAIAARLEAIVEQLLGVRAQPSTDGLAGPVIGVYAAVRGEPNLQTCFEQWRARGWRLALPRITARDAPLQFGAWHADSALVADRFGIVVPEPFEPVTPDLLVVPCVGFDRRGWRLGYGGGFYDRTLAQHDVPAVGVAFDSAEVDGFEPHPHDRALRAIVTPRAVWRADAQSSEAGSRSMSSRK